MLECIECIKTKIKPKLVFYTNKINIIGFITRFKNQVPVSFKIIKIFKWPFTKILLKLKYLLTFIYTIRFRSKIVPKSINLFINYLKKILPNIKALIKMLL